jgi:hypothetical protein
MRESIADLDIAKRKLCIKSAPLGDYDRGKH